MAYEDKIDHNNETKHARNYHIPEFFVFKLVMSGLHSAYFTLESNEVTAKTSRIDRIVSNRPLKFEWMHTIVKTYNMYDIHA